MSDPRPEDYWEERYAGSQRIWSGRPNVMLVELAGPLAPGRALDLGCGEGADPIWLAGRGWQVTAVDISATAVRRGAAAAAAAGIAEGRIGWIADDLATWSDEGPYDLVSAFFLQSPVRLPRSAILARAAQRIAPGGHLLVVSHAAPPPWATQLHAEHAEFRSPEEEIAALELPQDEWDVIVAETRRRPATDPEGRPAELDDAVVMLRRR